MFGIQISAIESQRQAILAQIEQLTRKEQELIQESLQYQQMEDEATNLLGALASLKNKFANHENATSALFAEISKLFQKPPTEPTPKTELEKKPEEEWEPIPSNRYETAAEISQALADINEVDAHLMAIASILDSCPEIEIPGRIWFFVQNIPVEFDDRILGYLPKSIRPEWHKQRTAWEEEARASIFPPETTVKVSDKPETKTQIKSGDSVQIHSGQTCAVVQVEDIGGRTYIEVKTPSGRKEAYRDTDLKLIDKEQTTQWVNLVDDDEEEDYELGMGDDWEESISDAASVLDPAPEQQEELFELDDIVQVPGGALSEALPKAIATIQSIDFIGASASYTLRMPNGKNQSGFKASELKKMGKLEKPTPQQSQRAAEVRHLAQTCLTKRSWAQIRTLCDREILQEMKVLASTAAEKRLVNNLPSLISGYIRKSGDKSDLAWLPTDLLDEVEALIADNQALDQIASTTLHSRGVA